ncbi:MULTISPECIES: DUF397 domain-containing protein [Micromonospora]|uniref:DUF397 domain-containing protein n=1 Tax=Micromonospora TaxID=1873 RepID=UPI001B36B567|nr:MULTISPECIES: DUF397 domain-containing protein [Micromonospora]MBQ1042201.1 DUF397 domain-containing protein [Micromonospora sp. C72]MBQ1056263.1 DUF397 domain-containing protein [Micromonospora sp. C32]
MDSQWRKSTRSGTNGACVEARYADQAVEVRDSKDAGGQVLRFERQPWQAFLRTLR